MDRKVLEYYTAEMDEAVNRGIEENRKGRFFAVVSDKDGKPIKNTTLKLKQKTHEFRFGANIFMLDELPTDEKNAIYKEKFASLFNLATLPFYWDALEPIPGHTRYAADRRRKWGRNFPFYFTQIAPFDYATWNVPSEVGEHVGAYLRDEQRKSMDRIENSGMAVMLDVGEVEQIHPVRKEKVGERLGLMALAEVYNMKGFEYKSPVFERMEVDDDKAVIYFKDLYYGLTSYGKPLHLFEIADESKVFHPAEAYVDEERDVVVVSSKYVRKPKAVRYAFKNYVEPELFSLSGLPVSSFRTDNW